MNNIFTDLIDEAREREPSAEFFLATVASVDLAAGVTITPDGGTEATTKKYKILTSGNSLLAAGDRVVVMRHSGTCIILGKIGTPGDLADFVKKTGDTMSGSLLLEDGNLIARGTAPIVASKNKLMDAAGSVDANRYATTCHYDKSDRYAAYWQTGQYTTGLMRTTLAVRKYVNDEPVDNFFRLLLSSTGDASVAFSHPAAWRAALGLGTSGNLPITAAQGGTGAASAAAHSVFAGPTSGSDAAPSFRALDAADITAGILSIARGGTAANGVSIDSTVSNIVTAASGFTFTSADYAQWGKIAMLHVAFNATTADTSTSWKTVGTVNSEFRRPIVTVVAQGLNDKTYAVMANGNIQVTGAMSVGSVHEITFTYLLN